MPERAWTRGRDLQRINQRAQADGGAKQQQPADPRAVAGEAHRDLLAEHGWIWEGGRKKAVTHGDNRLQGPAAPFQITFPPYFVPFFSNIKNCIVLKVPRWQWISKVRNQHAASPYRNTPNLDLQLQNGSTTRPMAKHPRSFNYLNCKACHFALGIKSLFFPVLSKTHRESI